MPEYLRHVADHVSWLMRRKQRETAETRHLAARISRILERRGPGKGLVGVLGADELRRAAGIVRPARTRAQPAQAHAGEAPPESAPQEEAPEMTRHEHIPDDDLMPPDEATGLAEVVAEIQTAMPGAQPAPPPRPAPARAPEPEPPEAAPTEEDEGEVPFEATLEPRAVLPPRPEFTSAFEHVLFDQAVKRLCAGDASRLREGIEILGRLESDAAVRTLTNLYRIAPPRWRPPVVHQLVSHPGPGIMTFLCRVLDETHEPPAVRTAALRGLFARDRARATDYLLKALRDPSEDVRAMAATYLGWLRDKRALPALEELVRDPSRRVMDAALHASSMIRS